jgi:hypothetical protein
MFRYNSIIGRQVVAERKISDIFNILAQNNPQLLKYVQKNTSLTHAK